jgi:ABC-type antimicrobial peptide transport system permease subunit
MSYLFTFRGVYLPAAAESASTWLFLRIHGEPERARQALFERLTRIDPDLNIITVRAMARSQTYVLQVAFWVTAALGGLALLLTVSGLFSVLSYVVERRAQEIGIRMALGATAGKVAALVLTQSLRPAAIGLAAGGALAAAVAILLMATPLASDIGGFVRVLDPVAYAASVAVIAVACLLAVLVPAVGSARLDPMATLRKD